MLDFCITFSEPKAVGKAHRELSGVTLEPSDERYLLASDGPPAWRFEVFRSSSGSLDLVGERVRFRQGEEIAIYIGYARDGAQPIRDIDTFKPGNAANYGGDFLYLSLDAAGAIQVIKSPVCSAPLYLAEKTGRQALASRATMAALAVEDGRAPRVSAEFLRWCATYGIGCSTASIFEGTAHVQINQKVETGPQGIELTKPDPMFLQDEGLRELYARDRVRYWDEAFEHLSASTGVVNACDAPIDFPLSGGKDSRLLLALTKATIDKERPLHVFTNGPSMSPDVRVAEMVCEALGLAHSTHDNTGAEAKQAPSIDKFLSEHAHISEGEMSPIDLTWGFGKYATVRPFGQDGAVLRNMTARDDIVDRSSLRNWLAMHVSYGDRCGTLKAGQASTTIAELYEFIDNALEAGVPSGEVPSLHRTIYRLGRWAARTWTFNNNRGFAPYPFVDFDVIRYTFNSGPASRLAEEFHFEMLLRLDRQLVEMPFAEQTWPAVTLGRSELTAATPIGWPSGQFRTRALPRHDALIRNFEKLRAFMGAHKGPATSQIIDRDRFYQIDLNALHESSYQCFWQMVQIALFELVPDLNTLRAASLASDLGIPKFD